MSRLGGEEAVAARRSAARLPGKACPTDFANGARLEGVEVSPEVVSAGGELVVRLWWSAGEGFEANQETVFIHVRDGGGKRVAQDDYWGSPLFCGASAFRPVAGEGVEETRRIALPAGLSAGPLSVSVGLYQPRNGRRVRVLRTEAPEVRRHAVTWPGLVAVAPPS